MDQSVRVDHAAELKALGQWVCWKYKEKHKPKPPKIPVDPDDPHGWGIDYTNPSVWLSYEEAKENYELCWDELDGYGFVVSDGDPYTGLDLDVQVDPETGEIPALPNRLIILLDSYAYLTPNKRFRIFVKGRLNDTGGNYKWVDPDTGEEHVFEVYDRKRFFTFTDQVINEVPIGEAQDFLDTLTKTSSTVPSQQFSNLPEIALEDEDLEQARNKVKGLFLKWDLPCGQIREGSRRNTLRDCFRKLVRNDSLFDPEDSEGAIWQHLNWANETMLYDGEGEYLSPLEEKDLIGVYDFILKDLPEKSPVAVQHILDELEDFLNTILVNISYKRDKEWKALKGLQLHGRKYGSLLPDGRLRIDLGWEAFKGVSRIRSNKTLGDAIRRFQSSGGLKKGRDKGDKTGHFILDLDILMNLSFWGVNEEIYEDLSKGEKTPNHYLCTDPHTSDRYGAFSKNSELFKAITHTTWYRGVGPSKIKYVLALYYRNGEASKEEIAGLVGVEPNSVYYHMKDLETYGIIEKRKRGQPFRLKENFVSELYRLRSESNEFARDEKAKRDRQDNRNLHNYQISLEARTLHFLKVGFDPEVALTKAQTKTKEPILFEQHYRGYKLSLRASWALKGAKRKYNAGIDGIEEEMKGRFEDE